MAKKLTPTRPAAKKAVPATSKQSLLKSPQKTPSAAPPATAKSKAPPPREEPVTIPPPQRSFPLTVSVQSSQGSAAAGNTQPANLLVIVTCSGWPVTELTLDHFTLMEHFEVPGQQAPFSNNICSFRNAGTGAYLLQMKPINGVPWSSGHHLGQLLVSNFEDQQGQSAFKLIIR